MVTVTFSPDFRKSFKKIKSQQIKSKIIKQIQKIKSNPDIGKPMRYIRKGTRELYIPPYRLSYIKINDDVEILDLYHKDKQ